MSDEGKDEALALLGVSRETSERLSVFVEQLRRWQKSINLISKNDLGQIWTRHVLDSGQLLKFAPDNAAVWVDIGAGGGFPGIVLSLLAADRPGATFYLIESDQRKAAFLQAVSRETSAPTIVCAQRAELVIPHLEKVDVIVSRATARLAQLIAWSQPLLNKGAIGLFPKGENLDDELTELSPLSMVNISLAPSLTRSAASIVRVLSA